MTAERLFRRGKTTEEEAEARVRRLASALGLTARVVSSSLYKAVRLEDGKGGMAQAGTDSAPGGVWRRAWADLAGLRRPADAGLPLKAVPWVDFGKGSPVQEILTSGLPPEVMEVQAAARGLGFP